MTIIVRGFKSTPQLLVTRGYASGAPPAPHTSPDPWQSSGAAHRPRPAAILWVAHWS